MKKIKVGIIGFGLSGRYFHSPLILAHSGYKIEVIHSSRFDEVRETMPDVKITSDPYELINDLNLDLVINCAPNLYHFSYSAAALENGKHVVVEKPLVNTLEDGQKLISLAEKSGKTLSVFHNRRWDSDFLTVKKIINSGTLGEIKQFESHFDRWRPNYRPERWREQPIEGSGLIYDLGSHLIDQALALFGRPESVTADIGQQKTVGKSDDYFHIILKYGVLRVLLHSSSFGIDTPRFQVFGDNAQFVKFGRDPQEDQLKLGLSPLDSLFGIEDKSSAGKLTTPARGHVEFVPSEKGNYLKFYDELHRTIATGVKKNPVSPIEALETIKIIELARHSSNIGKTINIDSK